MAYKFENNAVINTATNNEVLIGDNTSLLTDVTAALNAAAQAKGNGLTGFDEIGVCCDIAKAHGTQFLGDNRHNRKRYPSHGW